MSSILQKCSLSLCKRNLTRNIVESLHFHSNSLRKSQQSSIRAVSLYNKKSAFSQNSLRSTSFGTHSVSQSTSMASDEQYGKLMTVWSDVVRDLTECEEHQDVPDVEKWMAKLLQYTVPGGKKYRALLCVNAYKALAPREQLTPENLHLAHVLGWCAEVLMGFLSIVDDIQDGSKLRRFRPCWYLTNNVGYAIPNDGMILESCIYQLLKLHFRGKDCYLDLLEVFQGITMISAMGQCLDLLSMDDEGNANLDSFTMDRYTSIVKYKATHCTFILPVKSAMYFAGINDPQIFEEIKPLLIEMGMLYQIQDDYMDCYGDPSVTGKFERDIQEGKCSWPVVVALQRVTAEQRTILDECYGHDDIEKVERVKQLYEDLCIPDIFSAYETDTYNLLKSRIQQISHAHLRDLLLNTLERMYRRML